MRKNKQLVKKKKREKKSTPSAPPKCPESEAPGCSQEFCALGSEVWGLTGEGPARCQSEMPQGDKRARALGLTMDNRALSGSLPQTRDSSGISVLSWRPRPESAGDSTPTHPKIGAGHTLWGR